MSKLNSTGSSDPVYQLITPFLAVDSTTKEPITPDYLLWCNGAKYLTEGSSNIYILDFYNYLELNPGIGSIFGLNTAEKSFMVPQLKDRVLRNSGSYIAPYVGQEDAIQNITGNIGIGYGTAFYSDVNFSTSGAGALIGEDGGDVRIDAGGNDGPMKKFAGLQFDASRVVRTATETRVKSYGVFICIDLRG